MNSFGIGFTGNMTVMETVELTKTAEQKGFDYVWIADESPSYPFRDAFVNMTAIALNTTKIRIGSAVFVPYSRHPAILSVFASTLAELSNDRVAIGLGRGGSMVLRPLGMKMWDKPMATLRETLIVMKKMLAGETVDFHGEAITVEGVKLAAPPKKKVPLYLAARGQKTLEMVGELADGAMLSCPPKSEALIYSLKHIEAGAKAAGRKLSDIDVVNYLPFAASDNRDEALERVKTEVAFMASDTPDEVHQLIGTDMAKLNEVRKALREGGLEKAMKTIPNEIVANFSIAGTLDDCMKAVSENFKYGANQLTVAIEGDKELGMRLMGDKIIPHFK
jgi:5,10-methylenetetrahydromethanopterin reductase